jgi:hypothetical protein
VAVLSQYRDFAILFQEGGIMSRAVPISLSILMCFFCLKGFATDHNEPDLLNSFYRDRDGSGADIYHVFAYPSKDGEKLNLVLTLAPVPDTGRFDPNSVQRIYLRPSVPPKIKFADFEGKVNLKNRLPTPRTMKAYSEHVIKPIIDSVSDLASLSLEANNLPINQTRYPEIMATYSNNGMKAKLIFKNFLINDPVSEIIVNSNGKETNPAKLEIYDHYGIKIFAGGRDDAFFNDIAGFFRSINWRSALGKNDEFVWEGGLSYRDSPEAKETGKKVKQLIDRRNNEGVYNAKDLRILNNVNTLSFEIPIKLITGRRNEEKFRIWAESFLTEAAFNKINK